MRALPLAVGLAFSASASPDGVPAADGRAPALQAAPPGGGNAAGTSVLFIAEYRVHGAHALTAAEIGAAVYPYLGPGRAETDVKAACTALEAAYRSRGFGVVSVQYDPQVAAGGVVHLRVAEGTVARLRVRGARYFSPAMIKAATPSLAEGRVIDFNAVNRDMAALNQLRDRSVTPALQPGAAPGTYDIDLDVKDAPPVHASAELNNDNSPNTTPLRATAAVSDANLWQSGQGAGVSFQLAPQRPRDDEVFSGYYLAHFPGLDRFSLMVQGTKLDSNVSTLGGATVAGPGQTAEIRAMLALPAGRNWRTGEDWADFSHSLSLSLDYKHFRTSLKAGAGASAAGAPIVTPITYYPMTAGYSATLGGWGGKGSTTEFNAGVTLNFRGVGSGPNLFNLNRYGSDGGFLVFHGELSHTQDLPGGLQVFGRLQGQAASQPLVSSEEFSGGGSETVRGYLESETLGDNGAFASLELRSPSVAGWLRDKSGEWRFFVFGDAGGLTLIDALPNQQSRFALASFGVGSRLLLLGHLSGSCDAACPLTSQAYTQAHDLRFHFRVGLDF